MVQSRQSGSDRGRQPAARGHLLLVEPDALTAWSVRAYLQRWFEVETAPSAASAKTLLSRSAVDALVLSDQLPAGAARQLQRLACRRNPHLRTVLLVEEVQRSTTADDRVTRIEKPFELIALAHALGVSGSSNGGSQGSS